VVSQSAESAALARFCLANGTNRVSVIVDKAWLKLG